ncbi:regulatory protein RecX [Thiomicrorhabdus lithotrophica]|uniref:Regulatory protein RecX n=1 Tax=Thiomicrorhabdus lithotrophica TaxID=2949997 RepID=A0ABY8CBF6_9GAMM|nr:regulatory protein RecX [Thiomicrorhabdus lithotrophica]WEJ63306.1 recombination regulator RecX [Thiomicrorhabdus lithotrophica]
MKSAEEFLAELNIKSGADLGVEPGLEFDKDDKGFWGSKAESETLADLSKRIEAKAVALLAMREHGSKELQQKLLKKFPETPEFLSEYSEQPGLVKRLVNDVLRTCQENNWQSDERYLEQAVRNYVDKGHGPQKIRQKLQQTCYDSDLISAALDWDESDWAELAQTVLEKKYGNAQKPAEQKEQAKRMRFLQSRGFAPSTIWKAFR